MMSRAKRASLIATFISGLPMTLLMGCTTTFKGYSDVDPPFADPMLVGQSWSHDKYSRSGGQIGEKDQNPQLSLDSYSKDNTLAFGAKANLGAQVSSNLQAALSGSYSGVSSVRIEGTQIVNPNDVRLLTYTNGDAIVVQAIYAKGYQTSFDQSVNLDLSAQAQFKQAASAATGQDPTMISVTFDQQSKTATIAAPNTAIATRVIRYDIQGGRPALFDSVFNSNRTTTLGNYQIGFYSLTADQIAAANKGASTNIPASAAPWCLAVDVINSDIQGATGEARSFFCPQTNRISGATPSGYQPQLPFGYVGYGAVPIFGYLAGDDLHFLNADFDDLVFDYMGDSVMGTTLVSVSGKAHLRETIFHGTIVNAS